jgi:23S rRNA (uracil1939-C5)-methyltransferase
MSHFTNKGDQQMARQSNRRPSKKRSAKSNQMAGRLPRNAPPIEVTISHIGGRGDGIAKALYTHNYSEAEHDVFVPASLPGERLLVQPLSLTSQGIKARIIELYTPSPDRHSPRCDAFPACGGCRFQHWDETKISSWKSALVANFLDRAKIKAGTIRPLYSSPLKSRRRASFHLKCIADGAIVGFREHMGQHIVSPDGCAVLHPNLLALQDALQDFASAHLPAGFAADAHANLLDRSTGNEKDSNICLYIEPISGAQPWSPDMLAKLGDWAASIRLARLSVTDHGSPMTLFAPEIPVVQFGKIGVSPPPGAFLQATRDGEAMLQNAIAEIAGSARQIVDLFAGCGTLSLPLLDNITNLLAVEQSEDALAALKFGVDAAGIGGRVKTASRNLFDAPLMPDELEGFDMAILDPPRSGAAAQCQMLAQSGIATIAMVSCNPASFARDAAILTESGFQLEWVQVIDQFSFSNHLELIGAFRR